MDTISQEDFEAISLMKVARNIRKSTYYKLPKDESDVVRAAYTRRLQFPITGNLQFYNSNGTLIAYGYNRIVVGDYGVYIEFTPEQIQHKNIRNRWSGEPKRAVRYIWMQTTDGTQTKVYFQKGYVSYADYKPGMYYVSPADLYVDGKRLYEPIIGEI